MANLMNILVFNLVYYVAFFREAEQLVNNTRMHPQTLIAG